MDKEQTNIIKDMAFVYDNRCEISMQYEKENALKEIEYKLVDMEIPCDTNTIEDYYDYYFDCMGYESKQAIDRVVDNIVDEYYENN